MKNRRIQIPMQLYDLMVSYIFEHYDCHDHERFRAIRSGVEEKREALLRHAAYTIARTGSEPHKREQARRHYRDLVKATDYLGRIPLDPDAPFFPPEDAAQEGSHGGQ